jgi:O-antigen ligase
VLVAVLLGGFLLMASNSRGPLVAVALALVVVGALLPLGRALAFFGVLAGGALGFATLAALLEDTYGFTLYSRLFGQSQFYEVNTLSRLDRYDYALDAALRQPFLGAGLEVPLHGGYPHNILIEVALNLGLLGAALFVLLVAAAVIGALRRIMRERRDGWLMVLFTQYFVAVQFSSALYQATHFWLLLGTLLALRAPPQPPSCRTDTP